MNKKTKKTEQIKNKPKKLKHQSVKTDKEAADHLEMIEVLREKQRFLATLISNLPGLAYRCLNDADYTMEYISDGCLELTGYAPSDLIRNRTVSIGQIIHPEDRPRVWEDVQAAVQENRPFQLVYRILSAQGKEKWVLDRGRGVFDPGGRLLALEGFVTDITGQKLSEEALIRSQTEQRALLDAIPDLIFEIDKEGTFLDYLPARNIDLYVPPSDFIGKKIDEILPSEIAHACREALQRALETHELQMIEYQLPMQEVIHDYEARIVVSGEGKVLAIVRDISQRKQAEARLKSRAYQQAVVADLGQRALAGTDLSVLMDRAVLAIVDSLNVEYAKVMELLSDETSFLLRSGVGWREGLVGCELVSAGIGSQAGYTLLSNDPVVVEDLRTETRFSGPPLLLNHGVVSGMSVVIPGDERPFGVLGAHTTRKRIFSEDDIHFLQTVSNVLAMAIGRKRTEEALAAEKERLSVTLRSIGDGVMTTDTRGRIVLVNHVAEALTGWSQEEASGKPLEVVFQIFHEKSRRRFDPLLEKMLTAERSVDISHSVILVDKEGNERNISASASPIREEGGNAIGIVLVFRDMTEKRKMEEELLKAGKLESVGLLAGGIAHDFNNILTAILGNVSLVKAVMDPQDKLYQRIEEAEKASLRAKELSQQFLTFAKGGSPIKKTASITDLLIDSTNFALRGSNVLAEFDIHKDLWPVEVDEGQISQVIYNLVINAMQAMTGGGIVRIEAENLLVDPAHAVPFLPEGRYITLTVRDTGIGIPREHLQKIFDPYFTTKQSGSGLGLSTTYSIIHKHEGHIRVESELGRETAFFIYLPASSVAPPAAMPPHKGLRKGKGRILMMDDEDLVRSVAGEMLEQMGYEVVLARDGEEALLIFKEDQKASRLFDAVVMDLTVPGGMGGHEAIKILRNIDRTVPVIVSSGYSNDPILANYKEYGFNGMVAKPYQIDQLDNVLHDVMGKK